MTYEKWVRKCSQEVIRTYGILLERRIKSRRKEQGEMKEYGTEWEKLIDSLLVLSKKASSCICMPTINIHKVVMTKPSVVST